MKLDYAHVAGETALLVNDPAEPQVRRARTHTTTSNRLFLRSKTIAQSGQF